MRRQLAALLLVAGTAVTPLVMASAAQAAVAANLVDDSGHNIHGFLNDTGAGHIADTTRQDGNSTAWSLFTCPHNQCRGWVFIISDNNHALQAGHTYVYMHSYIQRNDFEWKVIRIGSGVYQFRNRLTGGVLTAQSLNSGARLVTVRTSRHRRTNSWASFPIPA